MRQKAICFQGMREIAGWNERNRERERRSVVEGVREIRRRIDRKIKGRREMMRRVVTVKESDSKD